MKGGRILPDRDPSFGSRDRCLAHFGHRAPRIVGDILERRQRLSGHRPAEAVIAPRVESGDRNSAAARQPDIIDPGEEDYFAIAALGLAFLLRRFPGD